MSYEREVMFIPRPERDPQFHPEALKCLEIATNNFSEQWKGNRQLHKHYEAILAENDMKRNNISNDGSGGRTWAAMLRAYDYVYINEDGYLVPTKVGICLLNNIKVRENVSKQILNLQIPNDYFLSSGFRPKFSPDFQIRPARFIIRVANQPILDYCLTKEEITFFCLTAKKDNQIAEVTSNIVSFRNSSESGKEAIKSTISLSLDHRQRIDSAARNFEASYSDIANTFMILCEYTGFAVYDRGIALRIPAANHNTVKRELEEWERRYPFDQRYLISLERFAEHAGLDVDSYKASFYGTLLPASRQKKIQSKVQKLLEPFPVVSELSLAELTEILHSVSDGDSIAKEIFSNRPFTSLNQDFVEAYLTETNPLRFEDKTGEILKAIGFEVDMRPKALFHSNGKTEIEILIHIDDDTIAILDAKCYLDKFILDAAHASHMASEYIPIYQGYADKVVKYFGYITVSDFGGVSGLKGITTKAKRHDENTDVQGAIITAKALLGFLDVCLEQGISVEHRKKQFIALFTNTGYKNVSEML